MKKSLLLAAVAACLLAGCSKTSINTKTGKIDCQSISYTTDLNHSSTMYYELSYARVYEFKSENGSSIYSSQNFSEIWVYDNAYTSKHTKYSMNRYIGNLNMERIYYLDLDSMTIDCVAKYSQYKGYREDTNQSDDLNHNEAYLCASKGYYLDSRVIKDITDNTLERHSYIKLGDNTIVSYTPRIS